MATDNKMQRILGAIGRFISKPIPKTLLLLCFAGIIGAGAYGMSQIKVRLLLHARAAAERLAMEARLRALVHRKYSRQC